MWWLSLLGIGLILLGLLLALHLWTGGMVGINDTLSDMLDLIFGRPRMSTKILVPTVTILLGAVLYGLSYLGG